MKIFIYAENEEITALKPRAREIEKKTGSQVNFVALKYLDADVPADLVLTLPHHKKLVEGLFAGRNVSVRMLDEEAADVPEPEAHEPLIPVLVIPEPEPEHVEEALPPPAATEEVVELTVGEAPVEADPKPRGRRR